MSRAIVIGTRGSRLAMCQAKIVQAKLERLFPERLFSLEIIKSQADKNPEISLSAMSGEGVFVKELETALADGRIDLAVHSLKDMPLDIPPSLLLAAVVERDEPRDALVSRLGQSFDCLPAAARIGTSSLRRRSQLLRARADLVIEDIRGNVDSRLRKLDEGRYDAVILAACGLVRLGLEKRITELLDLSLMLPEPGQGAMAIESRADDSDVRGFLSAIDHAESRVCVEAEREFLRMLGGGCRVPIAAYADLYIGSLRLEGAVVAADGSRQVRANISGASTESLELGRRLAAQLISQGARELLVSYTRP